MRPRLNPSDTISCYGIARWENHNFILVLVSMDDFLPSGSYPYQDYWLVSYTPQGQLIDYILLGINGGAYKTVIRGKTRPVLLQIQRSKTTEEAKAGVKQTKMFLNYPLPVQIATIQIQMDKLGHFHEQTLKIEKGEILDDGEFQILK